MEESKLLQQDKADDPSELALRIQLSAAAVTTSFVLLVIPSVETITFMAFLLGFLFPVRFALMTTLTMTLSWEIVVSMIFSFSGVTFPFKLTAWLLITLLGRFARSIRIRYFYEFIVFGALSALIFDVLVTISIPILFINQPDQFLVVLSSSLVFGILFTMTHTASNALLFSFMPSIYRTILPLLHNHFSELVVVASDYFDYLRPKDGKSPTSKEIIFLNKKRLAIYLTTAVIIVIMLTAGFFAYQSSDEQVPIDDEINVVIAINYNGEKPNERHELVILGNETLFLILQEVATVNYTVNAALNDVYVTAINGVWESGSAGIVTDYWIFERNEVGIPRGVNSTFLVDGDTVDCIYF